MTSAIQNGARIEPGPSSENLNSAGTVTTRISSAAITVGSTPPSALCASYERLSEKPFLRLAMPSRIPPVKPIRPTSALRSPPPSRSTMRSGQPRNASAPMTTNAPSTKRIAGEEPARALNSLLATLMMNAPSTRPMISGRTYCTFAALCRPTAPEISRRKHAMQKPMFVGLPSAVKMSAARPTAAPAIMTPRCTFFIFSNSPFLIVDKINTFCRKPVYRFIF